jgi:hypothetical protein
MHPSCALLAGKRYSLGLTGVSKPYQGSGFEKGKLDKKRKLNILFSRPAPFSPPMIDKAATYPGRRK